MNSSPSRMWWKRKKKKLFLPTPPLLSGLPPAIPSTFCRPAHKVDGGHLAPVFVEAGGLQLGEEKLVDSAADAICRALDDGAVGLLE